MNVTCNCGEQWPSEEFAKASGYKAKKCKFNYMGNCKENCNGCQEYIKSSCSHCKLDKMVNNYKKYKEDNINGK